MGDLNQIGRESKGHSIAVDNTLDGLRITRLHTDRSPALTQRIETQGNIGR
jgi:hypothetical protein